MEKLVVDLQAWYISNRRDLPFRFTSEPYAVWVSEIMAQQTRIDTMIPYYLRWMAKWPTINELALAPIEDVLKMWEGLGYYNRARKLHEAAIKLASENEGRFPTDHSEILALPGIGPYTAAAIASIALDLPYPAVDGNVLRVVSRLKCITEDIAKPIVIARITEIMQAWINQGTPKIFTQAMMELGALICLPSTPKCTSCPLQGDCQAFAQDRQAEFPVKKAKAAIPSEHYDCYLIQNRDGELALTLANEDGLMNGYYRFPQKNNFVPDHLKEIKFDSHVKHVFSHKIWEIDFYTAENDGTKDDYIWVSEERLNELPLITAHRKWYKKQLKKDRSQL